MGTTRSLDPVETVFAAHQRVERELLAAREALDRKNEELRQLREQFRVALASIGDGVITTDTRTNVTFMNPAAEAMTGWSEGDALGRPLEEVFRVVNEETRAPVADPARAALRAGTVVRLASASSLVRKDGAIVAIEDTAAPIRDALGNVSGCVMVFRDVTQRRRAEQALRADDDRLRDSAHRLQLAMSASEMGDWIWDAETNLLSLSPRAAQLFQLPANAPVSRDQLRSLVPPEDGLRTSSEFDRALLEKTDYKVEFRVLRSNAPPVWVAATGRGVYADNGAVVGMIGMVQDVTERREAEELRGRLAAVVESSTDAIVSKTLDSIITTWNQGAERLFGYKASEVIGRPVTLLIPPDHENEEPAILERIRSGESVPPYQTVRVRKDGTLVDVSLAISPIRDSQGRIIGASKIARDITAQKLAEAALRETDRRKDEFLATLAHELRNPLAPIRQATLIAQSPTATEAQKRWSHEVINRQVQNMALLLDDLLDISRITRGTLPLRIQPTDLGSIVSAAVETARPLIDAKRHTFSINLPREPIEFAADPMRLAQVLSNLLTNAAKYTDPDGRIALVASCADGMITISVTDTGIGIPPDAMSNLFAMFSQLKAGKDRSEGGLGIGLALAKGLVELHGGTIEARSAGRERGSEFIVRLPMRTQRTVQAPTPTRPGPETALRRRVLIADDNRDAAESLAMLLQMEGHEVTVVHDGREAVTAFEKVHPDAALLDIGMPGLNGYEIARLIRRAPHGRDVTLIAVTGWGQENDKAQATEAGFNHHFTKPVEPEAITALLARTASRPQ